MTRSYYRHRPVDQIPVSSLKKAGWERLQHEARPTNPFAFLRQPRLLWGGAGLAFASMGLLMHFNSLAPHFALVARSDEMGNPAFVLTTSGGATSVESLEGSLVISPPLSFDVSAIANNQFEVLLRGKPLFDTLYTFSIEDEETEKAYQWTYQVPSNNSVASSVEAEEALSPASESYDGSTELDYSHEETGGEIEVSPSMENIEPTSSTNSSSASESNGATPVGEEPVTEMPAETNPVEEPGNETPVEPSSMVAVTEPVSEPMEVSSVSGTKEMTPLVQEMTPAEVGLSETVAGPINGLVSENARTSEVVEAPALDLCIVDLTSLTGSTVVNSFVKATEGTGFFILKTNGIFDDNFLSGGQFLLLAGSKFIKGGSNNTYYVKAGVVENAGTGFTAYVTAKGTFKANGNSGTLYYEEGARLMGLGADTVMHPCSSIQFLMPTQ